MAEPISLSLTNFLNFVTKTGIQKLRFVEQIKRDEQFDFYGPLREHIKRVHKTNQPKKDLEIVLQGIANKQKAKCYPPVVKGYQKFWGRKKLEWIEPPKSIWQHADIVVNVAPEVGLVIDGEVHVLKLYFRQERLTKERVCAINHLLEQQLRPKLAPEVHLGILDIHRSKFLPAVANPDYQHLLEAEAEMFRRYWDKS